MSDSPPPAGHRSARLLLVHRYFWPDSPPYAVMLRVIASHWAAAGHDVEVLSSQPSYHLGSEVRAPESEVVDGVRVRRVAMRPDRAGRLQRPWNLLRFTALATRHLRRSPHVDVVMCSTVPQVLLGWALSRAARRRGARFVYHCMDLHPEIGRLSGEFAHPLVFRVLLRMDLAGCRRADAVVVLSDDMREALCSRDEALRDRVVVLNNFDLPDYAEGDPARDDVVPHAPGTTTIAFTGNLGRFQGLETVVAAALSDAEGLDRVRLVLMGDGAARARLETLVAQAPPERRQRVLLLPHGPTSRARALMRASDWGLVSLAPDVIRFAYPSKTATYLSEGLPVLAGVERDSSLVRDLEASGAGTWLPLGSTAATAAALAELARSPAQDDRRRRAHAAWAQDFSVAGRLERWDALLDRLLGAGTGAAA